MNDQMLVNFYLNKKFKLDSNIYGRERSAYHAKIKTISKNWSGNYLYEIITEGYEPDMIIIAGTDKLESVGLIEIKDVE